MSTVQELVEAVNKTYTQPSGLAIEMETGYPKNDFYDPEFGGFNHGIFMLGLVAGLSLDEHDPCIEPDDVRNKSREISNKSPNEVVPAILGLDTTEFEIGLLDGVRPELNSPDCLADISVGLLVAKSLTS